MIQINSELQNLSRMRFERYFSGSLLGISSCLMTALEAVFRNLNLSKGDRVCMPSLCPSFILDLVLTFGLEPVFIESERITWNMSPEFLAAALSRDQSDVRPKAILVCHNMGMPAQINRLKKIADQFKLPLIEESSQALGSYLDMNQCGTNGDLGIVRLPLSLKEKPCYAVNTKNPNPISRLMPLVQEPEEGAIEKDTIKQIVNQIQKSRSLHELLKASLLNHHKVEILDETEDSFSNKEVFAALLPKNVSLEKIFQIHPDYKNVFNSFPIPNHLQHPTSKYIGDQFSNEVYLHGFYINLSVLCIEDVDNIIHILKDILEESKH